MLKSSAFVRITFKLGKSGHVGLKLSKFLQNILESKNFGKLARFKHIWPNKPNPFETLIMLKLGNYGHVGVKSNEPTVSESKNFAKLARFRHIWRNKPNSFQTYA